MSIIVTELEDFEHGLISHIDITNTQNRILLVLKRVCISKWNVIVVLIALLRQRQSENGVLFNPAEGLSKWLNEPRVEFIIITKEIFDKKKARFHLKKKKNYK